MVFIQQPFCILKYFVYGFLYMHIADSDKTLQEQLPLIVGSLTAGLVFIIVVVVIAIVCLR